MNASTSGRTPPSRLGAAPQADGTTRFEVWAPNASTVQVRLDGDGEHRTIDLVADDAARTWVGAAPDAPHGTRYHVVLDGGPPLADPASSWQPDGVYGASAVVDPLRFDWTDAGWSGVELADTVIYEFHVGVFTPDGTFDAAIAHLPRLARLGITVLELMPVAAFPGDRNWGYDGVFTSAVQESYGGPEGLARFVDAAHGAGLAVMLDVVYNHIGPEGGVHDRFGPYLTDAHRTPWGRAVNVASAGSDGVRRTFIESACRWIDDFHIDGLRVDAVAEIVDPTAMPFLEELTDALHRTGRELERTVLAIAESSANDPAVVRSPAEGGLGFDAVWADDLHHTLRVALTGSRHGYYVDYDGVGDLAVALDHRWVLRGRYSTIRDRRHGRPADDVPPGRFVVFTTNHDHVGNTPTGHRPHYDAPRRVVAAATVLLSPFTPLLFMGEEYGDPAPFPYFVDHQDPGILEAAREGRRREFAAAEWAEDVVDPADRATYESAVLQPSLPSAEPHRSILAATTELLALRRRTGVLTSDEATQHVRRDDDLIVVERRLDAVRSILVLNLGDEAVDVDIGADIGDSDERLEFDSGDHRWSTGGDRAQLAGTHLRVGAMSVALLVGRRRVKA